MAEQGNQQLGDGGDNPTEAAKQIAKAAKQAANAATKASSVGSSAASAGANAASAAAASAGANVAGSVANATANAAAAAVSASATAGTAAAEIATGTAAGGPWGAIIAAAFALRHTLFKILIFTCVCLLFLIIMIVNLPSIMFDYIFGGGNTKDPGQPVGIYQAYEGLTDTVQSYVTTGHDNAMDQVKKLISDGGYDYDMSMAALIDNGSDTTDDDICYILSAYSVSKGQKDATTAELQSKLDAAKDALFTVTSVEKTEEKVTPLTYTVYKPVSIMVVTNKTQTGTINGIPQYRYTTATKTYYLVDKQETTTEPITRDAYRSVSLDLPVYSGSTITGTTTSSDYYEINGTETLTPVTETVKYLECTISPLNKDAILAAFGIDPNATYGNYSITNAQAIENMSYALKSTLFGQANAGGVVNVTADDGVITQTAKFPVPVTGSFTITSRYGERIDPNTGQPAFHYGIDIAGAHHCQIIAIADGTVVYAGLSSGNLNIVKIEHTDANGNVFYSRYLHLADIYVTEGQTVTAKQVIGTEGGAKGEIGAGDSTGPHLHFELLNASGDAYDPYVSLFGS